MVMIYKLFCLVLSSIVPFLLSLFGEFVFDDSEAILKNKDVVSASWIDAFSNDFWGTAINSNLSHKSYRPLTILSFRLNYLLNNKEFSALQFKLTNLVCHTLCCLVIWKSFTIIIEGVGNGKCMNGFDTAFWAAMLFSVHPIHTEAVSGIVGRADILAGLTFFTAFLCYCKSMRSQIQYFYLIMSLVIASIAMLFKENGVTVLGFCLTYEVITKYKWKSPKKMSNKYIYIYLKTESIKRIVLLVMCVILLLYVRWSIMGGTKPEFKSVDNPAAFSNNNFIKIATYNYIYFLNMLLFVWPQWLCYDWSMGCVPLIQSALDYRIVCILAMYLYGVLVLKVMLRRKTGEYLKRLILLAVSLIVIPFLPAANIFYPVGFVIAERILYIPSAGYCLFIAIGFSQIIHMAEIKGYKLHPTLICLILLPYGLRSCHRSYDWQNEYQLFVSGLSVCPLNAKVHYNVAKVADANQQVSWALDEYKESIRLYPEYYQSMNNLANLLKNQKHNAEAELYLRQALRLKKDFPAAWMNLGIVLANTKRFEESVKAYETALSYRKNYPDCLYNLGNLYLEMNKTAAATEKWFKAINLNSSHVLAWTNLLALLDNTGQLQTALNFIPRALTELPNSPSVNFAVANIYGKMDRFSEAEQHFKKAISLFGNKVHPIHYANLGVLYHRWKKYEHAEIMYKKALKIDPMFKSAQKNLIGLEKVLNINNLV